jgi:ubiquinone/menaquinone biosynthesis C-methylase UbiE
MQRFGIMGAREYVPDRLKKFKEKYSINQSTVCLDIGAGDNFYTRYLSDELKISTIPMDIKSQHCDTIIKGRMEDIPFWDSVVDMIFCCHTFEHTIDPLKTLSEFHRVLKPRRLLYLVTPYPSSHEIFTSDTTHLFVLTKEQLFLLLQKSGFMIMESEEIKEGENPAHWSIIIIAVKI